LPTIAAISKRPMRFGIDARLEAVAVGVTVACVETANGLFARGTSVGAMPQATHFAASSGSSAEQFTQTTEIGLYQRILVDRWGEASRPR